MKKLHTIITLICTLVVLSGAATAWAQVTPMSDSELAGITGQAGFAPLHQQGYVTNSLQFGGNGLAMSLANLSYQAERTGEVSEIRVSEDGSSFSFDIKNPGVTIRNLRSTIDLGAGQSLGTVSVGHIRVTTHGTVRVTVR
jgi:hypothetical protein